MKCRADWLCKLSFDIKLAKPQVAALFFCLMISRGLTGAVYPAGAVNCLPAGITAGGVNCLPAVERRWV